MGSDAVVYFPGLRVRWFLVAYVVLGFGLLPLYWYQINPDGISYISIAEHYLHGNLQAAINAHWSPLFSWLMVPLFALGIAPVPAAKVVLLLVGFGSFIGLVRLLEVADLTPRTHCVVLWILLPTMLYHALTVITPDALTVCLLTWYSYALLTGKPSSPLARGIICGLLGGLAYLAKSYNFYFFLGHFTAVQVFSFIKEQDGAARRRLVQTGVSGLVVFGIISAAWIGCLAQKYGKPMVGAAGAFNFSLLSPQSKGQPMDNAGFLEPPHPDAMSMWEDPAQYPMTPLKPWTSFEDMRNLLRTVAKHLGLLIINGAVLMISVLLLTMYRRRVALPLLAGYLLFSCVLYGSGYLPFPRDMRYHWFARVMGLILAAVLLDRIAPTRASVMPRPRPWHYALMFVCFGLAPVAVLITNANASKEYYQMAQELRARGVHGRIASSRDSWHASLYVAYYLGARYLGHEAPNWDDAALARELERFGVDYFFAWNWDPKRTNRVPPPTHDALLSRFREVTGGAIPELKVYACKETGVRIQEVEHRSQKSEDKSQNE
ncbi:MAG: hypothetical protein HY706_20010 [Candidatus Hydrogenedentes bacterium]|nr:hypothetical protein [Candidatus Hydrogenedentota bacterium]